jgi:hypothetical protein
LLARAPSRLKRKQKLTPPSLSLSIPLHKKGHTVARLLALIFQNLPFLFGIGFLTPLIAQVLERTLPSLSGTAWPLAVGLLVGGGWGLVAQKTGRWL